jgi:hypothetical protein
MPSEVRWIHSNASPIFYCNPEKGQVAALRPLHEVAHRIRNTWRNLHKNIQKNARTFLSYSQGVKGSETEPDKEICLLQILQINQLRESWRSMQTISSSLEAGPPICEGTNQRRIPNRADTQIISLPRPTQPLTATLHKSNPISIAHRSVADHFTISST